MKNSILYSFLFVLILTSCKKDTINNSKTTNVIANNVSFQGLWTRSFEINENSSATVNYKVYEDSIQYEMLGAMSVKYTILKDTFDSENNRWIGNRDKTPYIIFLKNISKDSITLLKMKVKSKEDALKMPFPTDTARSRFSSWNTFKKN